MLINLRDMLTLAEEKNCAIGSFNVYNVESLQAVLKAAKNKAAPVIVSFGEAYDSHMPLEAMASLVHRYGEGMNIPLVLHLDHSKHIETILRAVTAGFTSVMYDGSSLLLEENIRRSRYVASMVHERGISLEGELGYMNPEDGSPAEPEGEQGFTRAVDARIYAEESGADALAVAIGNAHGLYKGTPRLDFERLKQIRDVINIPLVLHGSSGLSAELLQGAILRGIRKININTEVSTRGIQAARDFLERYRDPNTRFEALAKAVEGQMQKVVEGYLDCFLSKR